MTECSTSGSGARASDSNFEGSRLRFSLALSARYRACAGSSKARASSPKLPSLCCAGARGHGLGLRVHQKGQTGGRAEIVACTLPNGKEGAYGLSKQGGQQTQPTE